MTKTTHDVNSFSKGNLKKEIELAKAAGVNIQATVTDSLKRILDKGNEESEEIEILADMKSESTKLLYEIDAIVDIVYQKLENDPKKFTKLIEILREARLQKYLESIKIVLDETITNAIAIKPIDFKKLELSIPAWLDIKIEDNTPAFINQLKNRKVIDTEIKEIEPKSLEKSEDFSGLQWVLYKKIGTRLEVTEMKDFEKMNQQEYTENKDPKIFFYSNRWNNLTCLYYKKWEWWSSKSDERKGFEAVSCEDIKYEKNIWLENIINAIFPQIFQQEIDAITERIQKLTGHGYNSEEWEIAKEIAKLYNILRKEKNNTLQNILTEKLDLTLELLNRRSWGYLRYTQKKERDDIKIDSKSNSYIKDKLNEVKNSSNYPESLLRYIEKEFMKEILEKNKNISEKVTVLQSNINGEEKKRESDIKNDIKKIAEDVISVIKELDSLLKQWMSFVVAWRKMKNEDTIYPEAEKLRKSALEQLQLIIDAWNNQDTTYFHFYTEEKAHSSDEIEIKLKEEYVSDNAMDKLYGKLASDENAMLLYEKRYFQKVQEYIEIINKEIDKTKIWQEGKEDQFKSIISYIGYARPLLDKIRPTSPLKSIAKTLLNTLEEKRQKAIEILNQRKGSPYVYKILKDKLENDYTGSDVVDKLKRVDPESQIYQIFLQEYSNQISEGFMDFQNKLAQANQWNDDIEKVKRLLKIKKDDWEKIQNIVTELLKKSQNEENVKQAIELLKTQKETTIQTIVDILTKMNDEINQYSENDVQSIPDDIHKTIDEIKKYKDIAEKEYPDASKKLQALSNIRVGIRNQSQQLNTLRTKYHIISANDFNYEDILKEIYSIPEKKDDQPKIPEDKETNRYLKNNIKLKSYLDEALVAQRELGEIQNRITNTYVKEQINLLVERRAIYETKCATAIKNINTILAEKYANLPKEDEPIKPSEILSLTGIFQNFKDKKETLTKEVENDAIKSKDKQAKKRKGELDAEEESTALSKAYSEVNTLCQLAKTNIEALLTVDESTTSRTFESTITKLVKDVVNKYKKELNEDVIFGQIAAFMVRYEKKLSAERITPEDENIDIEEKEINILIDKFLENPENQKWIEEGKLRKQIKERLDNEKLETTKELAYTRFISNFVDRTMSGNIDADIQREQQSQSKERTDKAILEWLRRRNLFIDDLNTKSLHDYTDSKYSDIGSIERNNGCPNFIEDHIKGDKSINSDYLSKILSTIDAFNAEYKGINKWKQWSTITLENITDPNQKEKLNELSRLYTNNNLPEAREDEFRAIVDICGRRYKSGFNRKFLTDKIPEKITKQNVPLIAELPFKDLLEKIDMKNPLEVAQWKQVIVWRIMSWLSAPDMIDESATREGIEKYLDILVSLPADVLKNPITIAAIKAEKSKIVGYETLIKPVQEFEEYIDTYHPEEKIMEGMGIRKELRPIELILDNIKKHKDAMDQLEKDKESFFSDINAVIDPDIKDDKIKQDKIKSAMDCIKKCFPENKLIMSKYEDFTSFKGIVFLGMRRKKILETLAPGKLFEDAIEVERQAKQEAERDEESKVRTAKSQQRELVESLGTTLNNIARSINNSEELHLSEENKLSITLEQYIKAVENATTWNGFETNINTLITEYKELVQKIKDKYINSLVKETMKDTYAKISEIETIISKLEQWTMNQLTGLKTNQE